MPSVLVTLQGLLANVGIEVPNQPPDETLRLMLIHFAANLIYYSEIKEK